MNRRLVLKAGALAGAGIAVGAIRPLFAQKVPDKGPPLDKDMVKEFVSVAHGDLEKTKKMLEAQPALINATWDWGGGDWETGLGGASHVGSAAVAEYLLSMGARMDVFCATMMGKIEIVKAFLGDNPKVVDLKGPHGIPLIRHAKAGQQDAIAELLIAAGAKA